MLTEERVEMDERAKSVKFRDWLLDELRKREWGQADLARYAGVSKAAVNKWIRTSDDPYFRKPDYESLVAIARALNVSIDQALSAASMDRVDKRLTLMQQNVIAIVEQLPDSALEMVHPQLLGLLAHEQKKAADRRRRSKSAPQN